MRTILLTLEYDGTAYAGWQVQPNGRAVQEVVEKALAEILGHEVRIRHSSGAWVPAIVTAGDKRAAKAVYGESKVYLEVEGVPLVARVVTVLQHVPEVSEVLVVGDATRLEGALAAMRSPLARKLTALEVEASQPEAAGAVAGLLA